VEELEKLREICLAVNGWIDDCKIAHEEVNVDVTLTNYQASVYISIAPDVVSLEFVNGLLKRINNYTQMQLEIDEMRQIEMSLPDNPKAVHYSYNSSLWRITVVCTAVTD